MSHTGGNTFVFISPIVFILTHIYCNYYGLDLLYSTVNDYAPNILLVEDLFCAKFPVVDGWALFIHLPPPACSSAEGMQAP